MKPLRFAALAVAVLSLAGPAAGHPAPFSYVDVRLGTDGVEISVVAHIFDVSHDLYVEPPERLLEPAFLAGQSAAIAALLGPRLQVTADGTRQAAQSWSAAEALPDRQAVRIRTRYPLPLAPGSLAFNVEMFPYDPAHQTFVNVYERDDLTLQAILDLGKTRLEYFPGSRQGTLAVARRFAPVGMRHVIFGLDHLVLLVGLLLLGGAVRQLALLVCAFAGGNAFALTLTALNILHPPARIIEPAIALGIVYVGADNLMVRGGRDMRVAIALAFGFIHGFWFANGLRAIDLPARTLGWSLLSFDIGVELAQLLVIALVGSIIVAVRARNEAAGRRLAYLGSLGVIAAGVFWFIQRVFFPAGLV
jgi:hypothetical protein